MLRRLRQVRFAPSLCALSLGVALAAGMTPAPLWASSKKLPSYGPPSSEQSLSTDTIGDFFDNLFSSDSELDKLSPGTKTSQSPKSKEAAQPKEISKDISKEILKKDDSASAVQAPASSPAAMPAPSPETAPAAASGPSPSSDADKPSWSAKRGTDQGTKPAAEAAAPDAPKVTPTYRVYHAPMVQQNLIDTDQEGGASQTTDTGDRLPIIHNKTPVVLPTEAPQRAVRLTDPPASRDILPPPALAPTKAAPDPVIIPAAKTVVKTDAMANLPVDAPAPVILPALRQPQSVQAARAAQAAPLPARPSPAVEALPTQFFPIMARDAAEQDPSEAAAQNLPVASNKTLEEAQPEVTRAVIYIHDMTRDVSKGLMMLTNLAGTAGEDTILLAPQFPLEVDVARFAAQLPDAGRSVAKWGLDNMTQGDFGWQSGGESQATTLRGHGVSSFTAMDLLLMYLADQARFPSMQQIVIAGYGMGGDYVERYAAFGAAPAILAKARLGVRFVVANPSSYLYVTSARPRGNGGFGEGDKKACVDVNNYPYGLENLSPYARHVGGNAARLNYVDQNVAYLLSDGTGVDPLLDKSCGAMAQGATRLARGINFKNYLTLTFGDQARSHSFTMIPKAANDPSALFGSYCGMALLFGNGSCAATR